MHRLLKCLQIRDSVVLVPVKLKYEIDGNVWSITDEMV